jgi:ABC-type phosphate transport system substrate-binding protein
VIEALERFGWAVGFGPLGNVRAGRGLRVLALDGVVPGAETVRSGQYPLYYEATLIYKPEELKGLAKRFLDFVASPEGRKAIEAFGAVPLDGK